MAARNGVESCEQWVSAKAGEDQIGLKVVTGLSGAIVVNEKDRDDT